MIRDIIERPRWARLAFAMAYTGVPDWTLRQIVADGLVRAKKLGPEKNCATVYNIPDIEEWIEEQPDVVEWLASRQGTGEM